MGFYVNLLGQFARVSFQQEAAFRANFAVNLLNTGLSLIAGLAGVLVLFGQVDTFQGWSFGQVLALLGVYLIISALRGLVIGPSLDGLGGMDGELWDGRFDFTALKPVNTQFLVSCRTWRVWALVDLALGLGVLGAALAQLGQSLSVMALAAFLAALAISVAIVYSLSLLLTSGAFWYLGVPLIWILDSVMQMGRYPVGIYPGWLRLVLTWIIPIGFITTVPAQALSGGAPAGLLLGGAALAIGLFAAASAVFRAGFRRYNSASS